jgi:hypothetical protein
MFSQHTLLVACRSVMLKRSKQILIKNVYFRVIG